MAFELFQQAVKNKGRGKSTPIKKRTIFDLSGNTEKKQEETKKEPIKPRGEEIPQRPNLKNGRKLANGNIVYDKPSGGTLEYRPDGSFISRLPAHLGGGAYEANADGSMIGTAKDRQNTRSQDLLTNKNAFDRDHIVPVSLGGISTSKTNLRQVAKDLNPKDLETQLAADVAAGRKTVNQARVEILTYKQNAFSAEPVKQGVKANLLSGFKDAITFAGKTALELPKEAYNMGIKPLIKPSSNQKQVEQQIAPKPKGLLNQIVQAPIRAAAIGASRLASTATEPYADIVGGIKSEREIASQVAQGTFGNDLLNTKAYDTPKGRALKAELNKLGIERTNISIDEIINAVVSSANLGLAITPFIGKPVKGGALRLSELSKKSEPIELSRIEISDITRGREDLVDPQKVEAFKNAVKTNLSKELKSQGTFTINQKTPTLLSTILENAATNKLRNLRDIAKAPTSSRPVRGLIGDGSVATVKPQDFGIKSVVPENSVAAVKPKEFSVKQLEGKVGQPVVKVAEKPKTAPQQAIKPKVDTILDKDIKVYRGEGKGIGNSTLTDGRYFADSEKFARTFGDDITTQTIPRGTKVFDFDAIKDNPNQTVIPQTILVDPKATRQWLLDRGYTVTKNTNTRGVEYVILDKTPSFYEISGKGGGKNYSVLDTNNDKLVKMRLTLEEAKKLKSELDAPTPKESPLTTEARKEIESPVFKLGKMKSDIDSAYHGTKLDNLESIKKNGLMADADRSGAIGAYGKRIYLSPNIERAIQHGGSGENKLVLAVRGKGFNVDPHVSADWTTSKNISPDNIVALGKDNNWYPIKEFDANTRLGKNPVSITPTLRNPLISKARKYKSAEKFVNSFNLMKWGEVTGVGDLPISKLSKSQMNVLLKEGLPTGKGKLGMSANVTDTSNKSLKVGDFQSGKKVVQPIEVSQRGNSYVIENGRHRLFQALANGDETIPVVFKNGEGKGYVKTTKSQLIDIWKEANKVEAPKTIAKPTETPTKVAKTASDINKELVSRGFDSLPDEVLAKYTPDTKKRVMSEVSEIMEDMTKARAIISGAEDAPSNVKQVLFNSMEALARKNNDIELFQELAKSPIASELSASAQAMGASGFNKDPNSVVQVMRQVQKMKEAKAIKKAGSEKEFKEKRKRVVSAIKKEVEKVNLPKKDLEWESFISEITC